MSIRVNIGCGTTLTEEWLNFDNSPAIKLANSPFKYRLARLLRLLNDKQIENIEWNKKNKVSFADASKKLPLKANTVECIYTSHMLEHLSRDGAYNFLNEAIRVLSKDGVLRVAVPDLKLAVNSYTASGDADVFMTKLFVQAPSISKFREKIQLFLSGYRHHQWMYDGNSLSKLMQKCGFRNVSICSEGKTLISDPGKLNLYERIEDSVYVEGIK